VSTDPDIVPEEIAVMRMVAGAGGAAGAGEGTVETKRLVKGPGYPGGRKTKRRSIWVHSCSTGSKIECRAWSPEGTKP
jgi:hypothetical protein